MAQIGLDIKKISLALIWLLSLVLFQVEISSHLLWIGQILYKNTEFFDEITKNEKQTYFKWMRMMCVCVYEILSYSVEIIGFDKNVCRKKIYDILLYLAWELCEGIRQPQNESNKKVNEWMNKRKKKRDYYPCSNYYEIEPACLRAVHIVKCITM